MSDFEIIVTDAEGRVLLGLLERSEEPLGMIGQGRTPLECPEGSMGREVFPEGIVPRGSRAGRTLVGKGLLTLSEHGSGSWLRSYYGLTDRGAEIARMLRGSRLP